MDNDSRDNPELEALFDMHSAQLAPAGLPAPDAAASDSAESVYRRIGTLARKLHNELRELGKEDFFTKARHTLPDSQERLSFIGKLMEQSADKCLNLAESQIARIEAQARQAEILEQLWTQVSRGLLSKDDFVRAAQELPSALAAQSACLHSAKSAFLEIVMAQDFQDLAGQTITRLMKGVGEIEKDLIELLALAEINEQKKEILEEFLCGPQINNADPASVHSQTEVDDLLTSLGF